MQEQDDIVVILFNMNAILCPELGAVNPMVGKAIHKLREVGLPMGPVSSKNVGYCTAIANGLGFQQWDCIVAEDGGLVIGLEKAGPPATYRTELACPPKTFISNLEEFCRDIRLRPHGMSFTINEVQTFCQIELKETSLTLSPLTEDGHEGEDVDATQSWLQFFERIISQRMYHLRAVRHNDGSIDVFPEDISRVNGLKELCRMCEYEPEQVLTVVCDPNDAELVTDTTIAVANAAPEIQDLVREKGGYVSFYPEGWGFLGGLSHYAQLGYFGDKSDLIHAIAEGAVLAHETQRLFPGGISD